jgi:hypothetical protein
MYYDNKLGQLLWSTIKELTEKFDIVDGEDMKKIIVFILAILMIGTITTASIAMNRTSSAMASTIAFLNGNTKYYGPSMSNEGQLKQSDEPITVLHGYLEYSWPYGYPVIQWPGYKLGPLPPVKTMPVPWTPLLIPFLPVKPIPVPGNNLVPLPPIFKKEPEPVQNLMPLPGIFNNYQEIKVVSNVNIITIK